MKRETIAIVLAVGIPVAFGIGMILTLTLKRRRRERVEETSDYHRFQYAECLVREQDQAKNDERRTKISMAVKQATQKQAGN